MSLPDRFIQAVRDNPVDGVAAICGYVLNDVDNLQDWNQEAHGLLLEAAALILTLEEQALISHLVAPPNIDGGMGAVCNQLRTFLSEVQGEMVGQSSAQKLESLKGRFAITLANGFGYEFTDGDLKRIQQLINQLREMVSANTELDPGHKQRLLKRLEKLQAELHKKMSDITVFYTLMGDAGVALGKLGEGAKPIVEVIKELAGFAWKSQARAEQLGSDAENPMLGHESEPPKLD